MILEAVLFLMENLKYINQVLFYKVHKGFYFKET